MINCSESGGRKWLPLNESQLIALENTAASRGLPGAGHADGDTQNSPLMGSLREKGGQHPILEVYYFHIM